MGKEETSLPIKNHFIPINQHVKVELVTVSTHHQLQAGLCRLSTQSRQIILPEAGHFIQRDQPAAIVNAVREILRTHKTPKTGNG